MNLSTHFKYDEMVHSDVAERKRIPNEPPESSLRAGRALCSAILEPIRAEWRPLHITSGYRSPELNCDPEVNGSPTSDHIWSEDAASADFTLQGKPPSELLKVFEWICRNAKRLNIVFDQCFLEYRIPNRNDYRCIHISWREVSPRMQAGLKPTGGKGKIQYVEVGEESDA